MKQPSLFDASSDDDRRAPPDQAARDFAVDPANDVVLEASAGTGKTRVLVDRYVRAHRGRRRSAPHPGDHVHAQGRGRDARARAGRAARAAPTAGALDAATLARLRERIADIQISTIDAFCFGLLREFPLEADVDPGFEIADETEMARFANEALDLTLRAVARGSCVDDEPCGCCSRA